MGRMDPSRWPTLDPELAGVVSVLPDDDDPFDDLAGAREQMLALAAGDGDIAELDRLDVEDRALSRSSGAWVRIYRPRRADVAETDAWPGVLYLHGGGFCMGGVEIEHAAAAALTLAVDAVVVSVEYRLAPEDPYPAGLEDCYAALDLLTRLPEVDPARVAVVGESAGGGLAAAVTLLARDRGGPELCFQALSIPALDDRLDTPSMRAFTDTPMWSRERAERSWALYLGDRPADVYAAPARATDLAGLPPAYVMTAELDPLRDEGLRYAVGLLAAGVSVELHSYPGTLHGTTIAREAAVVRRIEAERVDALRRGLGVTTGPARQL